MRAADPLNLTQHGNGPRCPKQIGAIAPFDASRGINSEGTRAVFCKYGIVADLARGSPDETITHILEYPGKYEFTDFGIEANQLRKFMVDNLRSRARALNVPMLINAITNRSGRQQRIVALESEVARDGSSLRAGTCSSWNNCGRSHRGSTMTGRTCSRWRSPRSTPITCRCRAW